MKGTAEKITKIFNYRINQRKLIKHLKQARLENRLTYEQLAEITGISSKYLKEIENHGSIPSTEKLGALIQALHISADPFFYPAAPTDNLDYKCLQVYLSQCSEDQITTILAIVEAYLRTYHNLM